ncbi:hypothetical protein Tco_0578473 [Tanacetum coccineum]
MHNRKGLAVTRSPDREHEKPGVGLSAAMPLILDKAYVARTACQLLAVCTLTPTPRASVLSDSLTIESYPSNNANKYHNTPATKHFATQKTHKDDGWFVELHPQLLDGVAVFIVSTFMTFGNTQQDEMTLTPQLHESAGDLPSLKLSLHSCSLPGSMNATQVSYKKSEKSRVHIAQQQNGEGRLRHFTILSHMARSCFVARLLTIEYTDLADRLKIALLREVLLDEQRNTSNTAIAMDMAKSMAGDAFCNACFEAFLGKPKKAIHKSESSKKELSHKVLSYADRTIASSNPSTQKSKPQTMFANRPPTLLKKVLLEIFVQRRKRTNTRGTDGRRVGQNPYQLLAIK